MAETRILVVVPEEERRKEIQNIINNRFPDREIRLIFFDQLKIKEFSGLEKEPHLVITSDCTLITKIKEIRPKTPIIKLTDHLEEPDGDTDEKVLAISKISPLLLEEAVNSSARMRYAFSARR